MRAMHTSPPGGDVLLELGAGHWLALTALALLPFLLLMPVRVGFRFGQGGAFDHIDVSVRVGPVALLFALPVSMLLSRFANRGKGASVRQSPRLAGAMKRAAARATRRIERFEWKTHLGTGDAATTCWGAGVLWSLKGTLLGFLRRRHCFVEPPRIEVVPRYGGVSLAVELSCIFRFTVGEIILALLMGALDPQRG